MAKKFTGVEQVSKDIYTVCINLMKYMEDDCGYCRYCEWGIDHSANHEVECPTNAARRLLGKGVPKT